MELSSEVVQTFNEVMKPQDKRKGIICTLNPLSLAVPSEVLSSKRTIDSDVERQ